MVYGRRTIKGKKFNWRRKPLMNHHRALLCQPQRLMQLQQYQDELFTRLRHGKYNQPAQTSKDDFLAFTSHELFILQVHVL